VLKRRKTFRYWAHLERTQFLPAAAIAEMRFPALRRLIEHAYANCPFYRESWDELGLQPGRLNSPADIMNWPVIDRKTIRGARLDMRSQLPGTRLISKSTGGSSGVPLQFDIDFDSSDRRTAAWHRGYGWAGAAPGTKQLYLWGVPLGQRSIRARLKENLYQRLHRRRVCNSFDTQGDLAVRFASEVSQYQPDVIVAYTNPLYEAARQLEQTAPRLDHRPRAIVVGAEKLHDFQREQIERVFGAPVFETTARASSC